MSIIHSINPETFAWDRKLLNGLNDSTVLRFLEHIKGKNYANVKNIRGYIKKMFLEYLWAEALLAATTGE